MLVVLFAVGAVASAAASAATPEWQINGKAITGSHEVNLEFSKIKFGDLGHTGGAVVLKCEGAVAKVTLSATKDEIKSFSIGSCEYEKNGACSATRPTYESRGLPWSTELYEEGEKVKDRIKSKELGKEVGYAWECSTTNGSNFDECTASELNTPMRTVIGGVDAEFATKLTCSQGGKAMGLLEGVGLYENPSKTEILSVTEANAPEWRQAGAKLSAALGTKWKGMVKLTDKKPVIGGPVAVECEETGEGSVGPGFVDEVTKVTLSKCVLKESGACNKVTAVSMSAKNLPWLSELIVEEGTIHDLIIQGSGGKAPGYELKCSAGGDLCEGEAGALETGLTNVTGGVSAVFDGRKLKCSKSLEKEAGALEGTHVIEATEGGKLEAVK